MAPRRGTSSGQSWHHSLVCVTEGCAVGRFLWSLLLCLHWLLKHKFVYLSVGCTPSRLLSRCLTLSVTARVLRAVLCLCLSCLSRLVTAITALGVDRLCPTSSLHNSVSTHPIAMGQSPLQSVTKLEKRTMALFLNLFLVIFKKIVKNYFWRKIAFFRKKKRIKFIIII